MFKRLFIYSVFCLILGIGTGLGCGDASEPRERENEETVDEKPVNQEKGAIEKTLEDVTGVTTIREGEKLKNKVRKIEENRNRQLEEALD